MVRIAVTGARPKKSDSMPKRDARSRTKVVPFQSSETIKSPRRSTKAKVKHGRVAKKAPIVKKKLATKAVNKKGKVVKTKAVEAKEPKEKKARATGNDRLTPRPNVTDYAVNPQFATKSPHPFVSVSDYAKMAHRAVMTNDKQLLQKMLADHNRVVADFLQRCRSVDDRRNPFDVAIEQHDFDMFDTLKTIEKKLYDGGKKHGSIARVQEHTSLLSRTRTGGANFAMLGRHTRKVEMTRGGKEGNNALSKDDSCKTAHTNDAQLMIERGVPTTFIDKCIAKQYITPNQMAYMIHKAVRWGHRQLAERLANDKAIGYNLNELHRSVLSAKGEPLKKFLPISVKKKSFNDQDLTPVHYACINNDTQYLEVGVWHLSA